MKKITAFLLAAAFFAACARPVAIDCGGELVLSEGWTLTSDSGVTCSAEVPSTVAGALFEAGILPEDILESDNYAKADTSLFAGDWTYTLPFDVETADSNYLLEFDGISYRADIFLNGVRLASSDTTYGVFIKRQYDVTGLLKKHNELTVRVGKAHVGDLNIGFVDWNPTPLGESMGIVRPVRLRACGPVSIEDVYVKPDLDVETLASADLEVLVTLKNRSDRDVEGTINLELQGAESCAVPVSVPAGETSEILLTPEQAACLHVDNPRVWWSRDLGTPELYALGASFVSEGIASDRRDVTFGIRKIESRLVGDHYRQFTLNGRDVLIKGAGWTDDIFLRDTRESTERQVKYVCDMNLNCIRFENIWGKDDYVYDLCDRYGLLAMVGWSCQWEWESYCGVPEQGRYGCIYTPELMDLAVRYFRDQVIRLHNHVSIFAWLTGSDGMAVPELDARYMEIYDRYEYRPYVCSAKNLLSPTQGWSGTKMDGPYEYVGPEYWYLDDKEGGAFGFNTETCTGASLPQKESLQRMIPEDSFWPLSDIWDYHCTASTTAMNSLKKMQEVASSYYGDFTDVDDFLKKAYAVDYNGTRAMFEAFRVNLPNTTGIVQWMLNSAWPSMYWQLYDWYGVPTAGYYGTKKACEPVQLIFNYKDRKVYAVNETGADCRIRTSVRVFGENSVEIASMQKSLVVGDRQPRSIYDLSVFDGKGHFVALSLTMEDGRVVDNFYCLPAKDNEYGWGRSNWYVLPIDRYADLRFAFAGEPAVVEMEVSDTESGKSVTLRNTSGKIAYMNILKLKDASGNLIVPAFWSDNFFPVLPGESKTVTCDYDYDGEATVELVRDNSRDRSKYANDQFREDDTYTVANPYKTVTVKQPALDAEIRNVVLMIGDGMGFEQVSCGWVLNGGHLNIDNCLYTGVSRTYAANALITDSCAGGTALAIGQKTNYGSIALDTDGNPVESVLKHAQKLGKKTGVAVTCRINDATPADFVCHSADRHEEAEIAAQYVGSGVDFITGGGIEFWQNRADGRDLVEEMKALGYTFVNDSRSLSKVKKSPVLGLFAPLEMEPALDRGPVLEECTKKALEVLDNKKGFFLMVEGSCIDDWCHKHKVGYMAEELFDFDRTVGHVLEWAAKDGHTLVVITADHATGGLTMIQGSLEDRNVKVHFSTNGHNGIFVPVFAFGPGADRFTGVHENAEVSSIIRSLIH